MEQPIQPVANCDGNHQGRHHFGAQSHRKAKRIGTLGRSLHRSFELIQPGPVSCGSKALIEIGSSTWSLSLIVTHRHTPTPAPRDGVGLLPVTRAQVNTSRSGYGVQTAPRFRIVGPAKDHPRPLFTQPSSLPMTRAV